LPVGGVIVDPLAAGQDENPPAVQQPNVSVIPYFDTGNLALGLFGSGWGNGGNATQRVAVAVGGGQVWVMAGGTSGKLVYNYDTVSLTPGHDEAGTANDIPASWSTGLTTLRNIAFYRGEVYVLGADGGTTLVKVFTPKGTLVRTLRPNLPAVPIAEEAFSGLDVAWGELWLSRPDNNTANARDILGQELAIFDATTGAFKGLSRHPLSDTRQTAARGWWDIAVVPEYRGAIVDRRMFARGSLLPGLATPDSEGCTTGMLYACASGEQRGTDSPWGMRWFLELWAGSTNATYRPVKEFAIEKRSVVPQAAALDPITDALGPLGTSGYYATQKREWVPYLQQAQGDQTLSDIAYNNRETRIDWYGDLAKTHWQRGDRQCAHYIVSDADIFIVGAKGERRYELARNFEQIGYRIAKPDQAAFGPLQDVRTSPVGDFCIDTTALDTSGQRKTPDGINKIRLEAKVGGRTITVDNTQLRVDNEKPPGSLDAPPEFVRAEITLLGTITDAWSGAKTATVDVRGPDGAWKTVCNAAPLVDPAVGRYACTWNTDAKDTNNPDPPRRNDRVYRDGPHDVRATLRDRSTGTLIRDGETNPDNNRTIVSHSTTVDNTPPDLRHFAPALGQHHFAYAVGDSITVRWTQTDALSGVANTVISHNTAPNGRCDESWKEIGSSGQSGDTTVKWDPTGLTSGLICLRAVSRDRAGNEKTYLWQAILRAPSPAPPATGNVSYHYAGYYAGDPNPGGTTQEWRSWGVRANLTVPSWKPQFQVFNYGTAQNPKIIIQHTAMRVAQGVSGQNAQDPQRSIEAGILSEGSCRGYRARHGEQVTQYQPGDEEGWMVYGSYVFSDTDWWMQCPRQSDPHDFFRYRTRINKSPVAGGNVTGSALYAVTNQYGEPVPGGEQVMYLHSRGSDPDAENGQYQMNATGGVDGTQAESETTNRIRRMGGSYWTLRYQRQNGTWVTPDRSDDTLRAPDNDEYAKGGGYYGVSGRMDPDSRLSGLFCTFGPVKQPAGENNALFTQCN
jgi:hypothetical protein